MSQVRHERDRIYPGAESLDIGGELSCPITQTLGTRKLEAPVEDRSTDGPEGPDRHDKDAFLDLALPVVAPRFALDTFEGDSIGAVLEGLNWMDPVSTMLFGGAWAARGNWVSILALEDWESYVAWASVNGLGFPSQGFGGVWAARMNQFGVQGFEDFELYPPGDELDGLGLPQQGFGGVWRARTSYYGVQAFDDFESDPVGQPVDGKNAFTWPEPIAARSTFGGIIALDDFQDATYGEFEDVDGKNAGTGWVSAWVGKVAHQPILQPRYMAGTGELDMRAQFPTGSELSRLLPCGTSWQKIRIAIRWSVQGNANIGGIPNPMPYFAIGVCSGTTNRFLDTTNNFVGVQIGAAYGGGTYWGFNPIGTHFWFPIPSPGDWGNRNCNPVSKIGGVISYQVGVVVPTKFLQDATAPADQGMGHRKMIFVDIEKGTPNFRVSVPLKDLGSTGDLTQAQFLEQAAVEHPSSPIYGHTGPGAVVPLDVSIDEGADGFLDTLTLVYGPSGPEGKFEISDVVVTQFA